jgi:hypothetical protein
MEKFNPEEYRKNLASDLNTIRKDNPKKAEEVLNREKETREYITAEAWQRVEGAPHQIKEAYRENNESFDKLKKYFQSGITDRMGSFGMGPTTDSLVKVFENIKKEIETPGSNFADSSADYKIVLLEEPFSYIRLRLDVVESFYKRLLDSEKLNKQELVEIEQIYKDSIGKYKDMELYINHFKEGNNS